MPGLKPQLSTRPIPYAEGASPILAEEGFGVVVDGVADINNITPSEFVEIERLLYTHGLVLFPNVKLTPKGQYELTQAFDPMASGEYGHGSVGRPEAKSILHPDLRNIPSHPAVQLIGNGPIDDENITQGLRIPCVLKHPSHETFHKTAITEEDSKKGYTRFYRFHIDASLYEREPPRVTTLYGLKMPTETMQTVRYDDGTGDELAVPLGGTAFVSGKIMFDLLPPQLKSLAVRTKVQYAPHPYVWMGSAKSRSTGLGMESDGTEMSRDDLPPWSEDKIKIYPMTWKNPVTGNLHFQVHPSGVETLIIDPLPAGVQATSDTLYPLGAHLTDLKEVRDLLYSMQRPAISPQYVYAHSWSPNDLALFHNRGTLHTITGAFQPHEQRAFWQCNIAASDAPVGPNEEDLKMWA